MRIVQNINRLNLKDLRVNNENIIIIKQLSMEQIKKSVPANIMSIRYTISC